jgi:hypothetical protein
MMIVIFFFADALFEEDRNNVVSNTDTRNSHDTPLDGDTDDDDDDDDDDDGEDDVEDDVYDADDE